METKKITWRHVGNSTVGYCGKIPIGSFWHNGINRKDKNNYAVFTLHSAPKKDFDTDEECKQWIESQFRNFITDISQ